MIFRPKSIDDLDRQIKIGRDITPPRELRKKIQIAIIDDEDFPPEANLRGNGFHFQLFTDLPDVEVINPFPVVLCDLQGVGARMNREMQGAHLIHEIKRNFPEKYVIAYTGASTNTTLARAGIEFADTYLKKDAPIEDWLATLDECIRKICDPVFSWKKFRIRLLENGMTPQQLVKIEDAFVRSFPLGVSVVSSTLSDSARKWEIPGAVRAVIVDFVASLAFKLMMGSN